MGSPDGEIDRHLGRAPGWGGPLEVHLVPGLFSRWHAVSRGALGNFSGPVGEGCSAASASSEMIDGARRDAAAAGRTSASATSRPARSSDGLVSLGADWLRGATHPPHNAFATLFFLGFTEPRRTGQGEKHNLFAGEGADVVVQAHHLDP